MPSTLLEEAWQAHQAKDFEKAARLYRDILVPEPANFDAHYLLGFLYSQLGQYEEAEPLFRAALTINPRSLDGWFNCGRVLHLLHRHAEAASCFSAALDIHPNIPPVLNGRAEAHRAMRKLPAALADYDRSVQIDANSAEAWHGRGIVLSELGHRPEAIESYDRALALRPAPETFNNRANALMGLKRFAEASQDFAAALSLAPGFPYARGSLTLCRLHGCDWAGLDEARTEFVASLAMGERVIQPGNLLAISDAPLQQLRCAKIWAANEEPRLRQPLPPAPLYRHDRIRVAYVSADFRAHAVATLTAGLFEHHDRRSFETIGISLHPGDGSAMGARLARGFERFVDGHAMDDGAIAALMRRLEVDIAVDMAGYTEGSRPGILARRPAPIQVNFLAFPGTMGAAHIDYIIADRTVVPETEHEFYAEKPVYLPGCFMPADSARVAPAPYPGRRQLDLPETGFVFCCFNASYKLTPMLFDVWMRLLTKLEGSVLWLADAGTEAKRNLEHQAEMRGVHGKRLIFAPRLPSEADHLARLGAADLFLDTLPYNAHATAQDALWAGLPVLTCKGRAFAGRVAASLLTALGLPELIAESLEHYETLASRLAQEPEALAALRAKLAAHRSTCSLFDTQAYASNLEAAYRLMWERHRAGEAPVSLTV